MDVTVLDTRRNKNKHWLISEEMIANHEYLSEHIKLPIRIVICKMKNNLGGDFCVYKSLIRRKPYNLIRINRDIFFPWAANAILWHELCHAVQAAQFPCYEFYALAYKMNGGNCITGDDYMNNPYEVDAREFSDYFAPHISIAYQANI